MQLTDFEKSVYNACSKIRKGRVSTYFEIAKAIRNPKASRAVGNALNKNPFRSVPCHRVVCSDGKLGGFVNGPRKKKSLLEQEGVAIEKGRIADFKNAFQPLC